MEELKLARGTKMSGVESSGISPVVMLLGDRDTLDRCYKYRKVPVELKLEELKFEELKLEELKLEELKLASRTKMSGVESSGTSPVVMLLGDMDHLDRCYKCRKVPVELKLEEQKLEELKLEEQKLEELKLEEQKLAELKLEELKMASRTKMNIVGSSGTSPVVMLLGDKEPSRQMLQVQKGPSENKNWRN